MCKLNVVVDEVDRIYLTVLSGWKSLMNRNLVYAARTSLYVLEVMQRYYGNSRAIEYEAATHSYLGADNSRDAVKSGR